MDGELPEYLEKEELGLLLRTALQSRDMQGYLHCFHVTKARQKAAVEKIR